MAAVAHFDEESQTLRVARESDVSEVRPSRPILPTRQTHDTMLDDDSPVDVLKERSLARIGRVLAERYELLNLLGCGSAGAVYSAMDHVRGERVAVKMLHEGLARSPEHVARFEREARAASSIGHSSVVKVLDIGRDERNCLFLVLELLEGEGLFFAISSGRLTVGDIVEIGRQLLGALAAAHARGIVHRDVKPENLFLHEKKTGERVLIVLDLGLAKILADVTGAPEPREFSTEKDSWVGTVRYAAPEQAWGTDVDGRLDIYALGVVAYETLTGHGPFDHLETDAELLQAHAMIEPRPPSKLARDLGRRVDRVILKALAKNREDRYQTAEEFSAALATLENVATPLLIPEIAAGTALGAAISAYFMLKLWWPAP